MYTGPVPHYPLSIDIPRLIEEWCPPPLFFERVHRMPREALHALQEKRLLEAVSRAWIIPFFARLWKNHGLAPGDIRRIEDLHQLPLYDVNHIRNSITRNPPFGDFMGMDRDSSLPMVIQTSGGTTGLPRPILYAPHDREIMAMLGARRLAMQGVRPGDIVQCTYSLGLTNGGAMVREALWKYTGAIPLMTGSGNITPSRRQIEIMKAWGTNVILGFPHYLRHLVTVARDELKIDPRSLNIRMVGSHLGVEDRTTIEECGAHLARTCMAPMSAGPSPQTARTRPACTSMKTLSSSKSSIRNRQGRARRATRHHRTHHTLQTVRAPDPFQRE